MSGTVVFVYGALCHAPLRDVVLARTLAGVAAVSETLQGLLLDGLTPSEIDRLEFYAGASRQVSVQSGNGHLLVAAYGDHHATAMAENLDLWQTRFASEMVASARDIMALYGVMPAAKVRARRAAMAVRGAATVRAAKGGPTTRRFAAQPSDVVVQSRRTPYAHFFAVEECDLQHRRFDGATSPVITRAAFISGDAVTVLPYDPVRDRVLLIEQFRAGPFARGDGQPWQLEAIAGRIDPGETPEDAARREAVEEAGLTLGDLLDVAQYYPSPGICAEYLYSYVAITDLADDAAGVFGVEGEAEDIRGHLMPFDDLMALIATREVANAPLILTAYWLAARRDGLRGA